MCKIKLFVKKIYIYLKLLLNKNRIHEKEIKNKNLIDFTADSEYIDITDSEFILFKYLYPKSVGCINLGDYVQTIALKEAIKNIFTNVKFSFFDRDSLYIANMGGGKEVN